MCGAARFVFIRVNSRSFFCVNFAELAKIQSPLDTRPRIWHPALIPNPMKPSTLLFALFVLPSPAIAEITPASFDLPAIRDASTLETSVIQDWQPVPKLPGVKQKLVEITICEWWSGQKVRLPVTFCVPDVPGPCTQVILGNMGLALKPALPTGTMLRLLTERGVGVVLIGMSTIDAMKPEGTLHLGMKEQLLKTKDARFTPAWIWGMSDMRALTAAMVEAEFQPEKVIATGGSKRGVGAAICGIHDDRFTGIFPVVAPILGNPGGAYVRGSALLEESAQNAAFLQNLPAELPATARAALEDRDQNRANQSITKDEAVAAAWSDEEITRMNDEAWNACRITLHLDEVRSRGLEFFYQVGSNDNVCPAIRILGGLHPSFPVFIQPGGQHGGPKTSGFTMPTPSQPEAEENFFAFCLHHFFGERGLPESPRLESRFTDGKLHVTVTFAAGVETTTNTLSLSVDRQAPYTFATEYDHWESTPLTAVGGGVFTSEIPVPGTVHGIDFISTHVHVENLIPFHVSSPYGQWKR